MGKNEIADKATGIVFDVSTPQKAVESLLEAQTIYKSLERTSKRIKAVLRSHDGLEHDNHLVRVMNVQRATYNKGKLREFMDEDLLDNFLKVEKGKLDDWLKEQVQNGTDYDTHGIRMALEPDGLPFEVIKLEKLTR